MKRFASAIWHDGVTNGIGVMSTESGLLRQVPYTFSARFQGMPGANPEELMAAAYAASYSQALAAELEKSGFSPEMIRTAAVFSIDQLEAGWTVTQIQLDVICKIPDADEAAFIAAANAAKADCPISRLLNTKITLSARLESSFVLEQKAGHKSASNSAGRRANPSKSQKEFEQIV